jgi:hypothetical protein
MMRSFIGARSVLTSRAKFLKEAIPSALAERTRILFGRDERMRARDGPKPRSERQGMLGDLSVAWRVAAGHVHDTGRGNCRWQLGRL